MDEKLKGYPEKQENNCHKFQKKEMFCDKACFEQIRENFITFNKDLVKLIADVALLKKSQEFDSEVIRSLNIQFDSMNKALASTNVFTEKIGKKQMSRNEVFSYLKGFPGEVQSMLFEKPELLTLW